MHAPLPELVFYLSAKYALGERENVRRAIQQSLASLN